MTRYGLIVAIIPLATLIGCGKKESASERPAVAPQEASYVNVPTATDDPQAIAAIKKLGAKFEYDAGGLVKIVRLENTDVTDEDLRHLDGLGSVDLLVLRNTAITDAGLAHVAKLVDLKGLNLTNTKITDAGLKHLRQLRKLQGLVLLKTQLSQKAVDRLRLELPATKVHFEN